jgi:hypothetical protein
MDVYSATHEVNAFLDGIDMGISDLVCAEQPMVPEVDVLEVLAHPA